MRKGYLAIAMAAIIVTMAATIAVIIIEQGVAFQSQTDSIDNIAIGDYVKATDPNGKMVSISPVTYVQTEDKESYELSDVYQSALGTLEIRTENNQPKNLTAIVDFQERGTWLFVESMNLSTQREVCFVVLVNTLTVLNELTVITIDGNGCKITDAATVSGSWKVWGVGPEVDDYVVSEHPGDVFKGFIVLVDSSLTLTHHYNALTIFEDNKTIVENRNPSSINDPVIEGGNWRIWNIGTTVSSYNLTKSDLHCCTDTKENKPIFDSTNSTGIAGKQTDPVDVVTGTYQFSITIKYKSNIRIDPTNYQGDNMKSNITFILSNKTQSS